MINGVRSHGTWVKNSMQHKAAAGSARNTIGLNFFGILKSQAIKPPARIARSSASPAFAT